MQISQIFSRIVLVILIGSYSSCLKAADDSEQEVPLIGPSAMRYFKTAPGRSDSPIQLEIEFSDLYNSSSSYKTALSFSSPQSLKDELTTQEVLQLAGGFKDFAFDQLRKKSKEVKLSVSLSIEFLDHHKESISAFDVITP